MSTEDVDILLRLRNLQQFVSGTREAARGLTHLGTEAVQSSARTRAAAAKVPGVIGLIGRAARTTGGVIAASGRGIVSTFGRIGVAAGRTARVVREHFGSLRASMSKPLLGGGMASGLLGGLLAYASFSGIKQAIDFTQQLGVQSGTTAKIMGMSTQKMAEWFALASANNVNQRTLAMSFRSMATLMTQFSSGGKTAVTLFKSMGIGMGDVKKAGGDMNLSMMMILDHLNKMPGGAAKTYAATRLLGRGWQSLMPLLGQGSKHLLEEQALARRLGVTMGSDTAAQAMKLHDAEVKLHLVGMGLQIFIATKLVPVFLKVIDKVIALYAAIRVKLGPIFQWIGGVIRAVSVWLQHHQTLWGAIKQAMLIVIPTVLALRVAFALLNLVFRGNPIIMIVTLLIALAAALIYAYNHNEKFRHIVQVAWKAIKDAARAAWPVLKVVFNAIKVAVQAVITAFIWFGNHWGAIWGRIKIIAQGAWNTVLRPVFRAIATIIRTVVIPILQVLWVIFQTLWKIVVAGARIAWPILRIMFTILGAIIKTVVIPALIILWNTFKTTFNIISTVVSFAWNNIVRPILDAIKWYLSSVVQPVVQHFGDAFHAVFTAIADAVSWVWNNVLGPFVNWITGAISTVVNFLDKIVGVAKAIINLPGAAFNAIFGGGGGTVTPPAYATGPTVAIPQSTGATPFTPGASPLAPHGASGLTVTRSGLVTVGERGSETLMLPTGARVQPLKRSEKTKLNRGSLRNMNLTTVVQIDRREIARATGRFVDDEAARGR